VDKLAYEHAPNRLRRRRMLVAMLLGSSLATVGAGAMSLAVFTDSKASTGAWTTGSITLGVSPTAAFTVAGVMPGDSGTQIVGVTNSGTSQLRYALTSSSTNTDAKGLGAQMTLLITNGTVVSGACTGTALYSGPLSAAAFGSVAQGAQAGDRNVNAGATDNLCFGWSFPATSGNAFQTATTTTTFTFSAEQTANNP
jgi:spore coat-associated protein N